MKKMIFSLAAAAACLGMQGQQTGLTKEITIDREIVPELRAAQRPSVFPSLLRPEFTTRQLPYGAISPLGQIPSLVDTYEPAPTEPAVASTPFRGYILGQYFPAANVGLSAGYRLFQKPRHTGDIWLQFNNTDYKGLFLLDNPADGKRHIRSLDGTVGFRQRHTFDAGIFSSATSIALSNFSPVIEMGKRQTVVNTMSVFEWQGTPHGDTDYHLGLNLGVFRFNHNYWATPDGNSPKDVNEIRFGLRGGISQHAGRGQRFGVDLDAQFVRYGHFAEGSDLNISHTQPLPQRSSLLSGQIALTPYYLFENEKVQARLGVRAAYVLKGYNDFRVAPDVRLSFTPARDFAIALEATGGERLNTLGTLFQTSRYICSNVAYRSSSVPLDGKLSMRIGPFSGVSLELFGAYSMADHWLTPMLSTERLALMGRQRLRAARLGGTLRVLCTPWCEFYGSFQTTLGHELTNRYFAWDDRAKTVGDFRLTSRPWHPLSLSVGFEMRRDRYSLLLTPASGDTEEPTVSPLNIGNISNLYFDASYAITPALSASLHLANLLNREQLTVYGVPARGLNGMAGVEYKF